MTNKEDRHKLEIARMRVGAEKHGFKPYVGSTHDLDLSSKWCCPYCGENSVLKVNSYGDGLFCDLNPYECEYEFENYSGRLRHQTVWFSKFLYPKLLI